MRYFTHSDDAPIGKPPHDPARVNVQVRTGSSPRFFTAFHPSLQKVCRRVGNVRRCLLTAGVLSAPRKT
jgi:hypothetical protein